MHRVYNSAFMNMLRDGETEKFRGLIQETLQFDPGILKRLCQLHEQSGRAFGRRAVRRRRQVFLALVW